jgi:hypothetical protein
VLRRLLAPSWWCWQRLPCVLRPRCFLILTRCCALVSEPTQVVLLAVDKYLGHPLAFGLVPGHAFVLRRQLAPSWWCWQYVVQPYCSTGTAVKSTRSQMDDV